MANAKLKASTSLTPVPKASKASPSPSVKAVLLLIAKAVTSVRATVQSVTAMEPIVGEAALAALRVAADNGNAMPIDRLVKDIEAIAHPMTKAMVLEIVAWTKACSPVYWDSKKAVHLRKESEDGYKPFDLKTAEAKAFYETDQAVNARKAGTDAHRQGMKPLSFKDMAGRAMGMRKTWESAQVKDSNGEVRGIVAADDKRAKELFDAIETAAKKLLS